MQGTMDLMDLVQSVKLGMHVPVVRAMYNVQLVTMQKREPVAVVNVERVHTQEPERAVVRRVERVKYPKQERQAVADVVAANIPQTIRHVLHVVPGPIQTLSVVDVQTVEQGITVRVGMRAMRVAQGPHPVRPTQVALLHV